MTINELSLCYKIDIEKLKKFEDNGLITSLDEFDENGLKRLCKMCTLYDSGLSMEEIKLFLKFSKGNNKAEQVKILSAKRQKILDDIHKKQKSLDNIDYFIYEIKNKTV